MKTMYGYDVESVNDFCVAGADKKFTMIAQLLIRPGKTLINSFPILAFIPAWFPGAPSHKIAMEVKRLTDELIRLPVDWAKMRMVCQLEVLFCFSGIVDRLNAERRDSFPILCHQFP